LLLLLLLLLLFAVAAADHKTVKDFSSGFWRHKRLGYFFRRNVTKKWKKPRAKCQQRRSAWR